MTGTVRDWTWQRVLASTWSYRHPATCSGMWLLSPVLRRTRRALREQRFWPLPSTQ
jgi:alpha-beta hydrolase superfamily lysophospholipase